MHIDISEFYRSIYTHSLTAIKIGIEGAEAFYRSNSNNGVYRLYVKLDEFIRGLNGKRTNGLLVGPYISHVLSEAVLANLDTNLLEEGIEFTRYADDYEIIVHGLEQIKEGKTKDFNTVCDRLEKKYRDEAVSN